MVMENIQQWVLTSIGVISLCALVYTTWYKTMAFVYYEAADKSRSSVITSVDIAVRSVSQFTLWSMVIAYIAISASLIQIAIINSDVAFKAMVFFVILSVSLTNVLCMYHGVMNRYAQACVLVVGYFICAFTANTELSGEGIYGFPIMVGVIMTIPATCVRYSMDTGIVKATTNPFSVVGTLIVLFAITTPAEWGLAYHEYDQLQIITPAVMCLVCCHSLTQWSAVQYLNHGGKWKYLYVLFWVLSFRYCLHIFDSVGGIT